jgi:hypothetical protein
MVKTTQIKKVALDVVPTPAAPSVAFEEQDWSPNQGAEFYVVTRGGFRVSDHEYLTPDWPQAIVEMDFWQRIVNRHPDGTRVEVVRYDKKKHRVW